MSRRFFLLEAEVYRAGQPVAAERGHMTKAHMEPYPLPQPLESTEIIRASDLGYCPLPGDAVQEPYLPLLDSAFEIDRQIYLPPQQSATGFSVGYVRLLNANGTWDTIAPTRNIDGRFLTVRTGTKIYDHTRGIEKDPAYATLRTIYAGTARPWFLSERELVIPVRDASYLLEVPYQSSFYQGSGGYEGPAEVRGVPKPRARGGTSTFPIRNVTPVLVDPINRIYQVSDAPVTFAALYEGGTTNIPFDSDTTNLYSGVTPPGYYRTDRSKAMFQLGSTPQRQITVDFYCSFPIAGYVTSAPLIARHIITEDVSIQTSMIDTTSFAALHASFPYDSGWYFGSQQMQTFQAVDLFLRSIGAKLLPGRDGKLRAFSLRALAGSTVPSLQLDTTNVVSLTPRQLDSIVDPPPFQIQSGHSYNNTIQSASDLFAAVSDANRQYLGKQWRYAPWSSNQVLLAYRRPNNPPPVETALVNPTQAQLLSSALGALWGTQRRLYDVTVPLEVALDADLGMVVSLTYPAESLRSGRIGQIVGESLRSSSNTAVLQVLI
jgi:hypothetical protein